MAKIVSVVGGRPQFIKEAITGIAIRKKHTEVLVHTGQHYDFELSQNILEQLGIIDPKYNLGVGSASHAKQTAAVMVGVEDILLKEKPDLTLVYGDMNSTLGACIASAKMKIPVAHIEAGSRIGLFDMPEEQNRIVTDHLSHWNFASNQEDFNHLSLEGLSHTAYLTGDVMYDAYKYYSALIKNKDAGTYWKNLLFLSDFDEDYPREWYFATVHRPENTDEVEKVGEILEALNELPHKVLMPVHPRINERIRKLRKEHKYENIIFVKPVGYLESLFFTKESKAVITDSGGLQREAYWGKVPCTVILRRTDDGVMIEGNCIVKARPEKKDILDKVLDTVRDPSKYCFVPYGDAHACDRIADILSKECGSPSAMQTS